MTWVPPEGRALLEGTPVFGSVEEIDAAAAYAQDVMRDTRAYVSDVRDGTGALASVTSAGVAKISSKLSGRLAPGATSLHESASAAKTAFNAYAAEVDRIHTEAARLVARVDEALGTIRGQSAEIERIADAIGVSVAYAWNDVPPGTLPEPRLGFAAAELDEGQREAAVQNLRSTHEWSWLLAASLWHQALVDIDTAKTRWAQLIEERRGAEQRLLRALGDTSLGHLLSVSGDSGSERVFTIAAAISGELRGVVAEEAPELAKSHPLLAGLLADGNAEHIWDAPPPPAEVAAWWDSLPPEDRERLIAEAPWVIGNLPGLPFEVRDAANRKLVEFTQRYPQSLTPEQLKLMAEIRDILKREARQRVLYGTARPPIQLVALDMTGAVPKAAVGYGDLDAATHTTWDVPGMNSDAPLALEGWDEASRNLYRAQQQVSGFAGSNAVVAWLGYDTPGLAGVLGTDSAAAGAQRFAAELDGAYATREAGGNGVPVVNVLSHSYGTTLATIALTLVQHPVDALVMLGSAGPDTGMVPSYEALNVKEASPGQRAIYTTHASDDHLAPFGAGLAGRGQPNPGATGFGFERYSPVYGGGLSFSSDGDPAHGLKRTDGHSVIGEGEKAGMGGITSSEGHGYLDRNTQSLDSVAQITMDQVSEELANSFTRTEGESVEWIVVEGQLVPLRVGSEDD
ncbi:alpha/beta hydrolase [Leucobacter massiliensis]|uniref:DUF1023 domain-containing protein n=1 Tax=Leucobacter massiliensis TaxID=1686285 RepID=A0A2S9QLW3_9MICO|nr:alpha/beta hydrolase [Leucobacter massiliensis]PRI10568.1 hypothetical protein B4915_11255 [Leucobacter massiliensis]